MKKDNLNKKRLKFIEKSVKIHGNKYDYSLVNYINQKIKVKIICPMHGEFEQTPKQHIAGYGCKKCSLLKSKNEFINELKEIYGDKYEYDLINYQGNNIKVKIICKKHGEFEQTPHSLLNGIGCQKCNKKYKKTTKEFIEEAKKIHKNKYDYTLTNYKGTKYKIKIICPIHGEFEQRADIHLNGHGCPICSKNKKLTIKKFVNNSKEIHNNKYDYSLVDYKNSHTKVRIICPIHGEFEQIPINHLQGNGCPICGKNKKLTTDKFIEEAKKIHNNKYDYSLVGYKNSHTKVRIICPIHGEFEQTPNIHLSGSGCSKCAYMNNKNKLRLGKNEFIKRALKIHGDKYNYSLVKYNLLQEKIKIICSKHGEFEQTPESHLRGYGCPKCSNSISNKEIELKEFIKLLNINFIKNSKNIIQPYELDIFIPSKNIAIEFNGLYWHSEIYKNKNYHLNKTIECEKQNIQLIHIFEDEWTFKKDIVKSRLKNILGLTENKIYGRKTIIKEIPLKEAKTFMNENHLQGYTNSSVKLGLFYNNELVSVMLFNKPRLGIGSKFDGYELSRFTNKLNTNIIGGASKLLKYFIKTYQPKEIRSYADRRWSDGRLYKTLDFTLSHINDPNYWYIINGERKHRFGFRKEKLKKQGFDTKNLTEHEIMLENNFYRIYDCGTLSYKLIINN